MHTFVNFCATIFFSKIDLKRVRSSLKLTKDFFEIYIEVIDEKCANFII